MRSCSRNSAVEDRRLLPSPLENIRNNPRGNHRQETSSNEEITGSRGSEVSSRIQISSGSTIRRSLETSSHHSDGMY